ncbi:acyl transferase [Lutimonas halocynthiae]|uniref:acyl transferase n=1 Tax=Lutimonas halocynthiae TaxID=1446477 RepID=UPI0025B60E0A|nr:acyl transferase [Lutimonas halocynthiae]MDN3641522.1 acyl transferase [Lutimonas halocynthiae]
MDLFNTPNFQKFELEAMKIFKYQATNNKIYRRFIDLLGIDFKQVDRLQKVPFLPIEFFKSHDILSTNNPIEQVFTSSGTTGMMPSRHLVTDLKVYEASFRKGFDYFYGSIEDYTVLALLPGYLERKGSSLIYMVDDLIKKSNSKHSGFYLNELDALADILIELDEKGEKILLIGVTYALLDLIEKRDFQLNNTIIMETGGMKGKRRELVRTELHELLSNGFGVAQIHSEYGMTELLSQAYSLGDGVFETPPWMHILIRDTEDPFQELLTGRTGGINVIDLANINSCSFIATQDLGRKVGENKFEVLGRFDHSDIRGCNLMVV